MGYPLIEEKKKKTMLLSPKFESALERISPSLEKFEAFYEYLTSLTKGVKYYNYQESENDSEKVRYFINQLDTAKKRGHYNEDQKRDDIILGVEKGRLRSLLGADSFQFSLTLKKPDEVKLQRL